MRIHPCVRRNRPAGFTVVELLVVIAIISVLVALTSAAVQKALNSGGVAAERASIGDMETALRAALKDMNDVDYVPSVLLLKNTYLAPTAATSQLEIDSVAYLRKLFGQKAISYGTFYYWATANGKAVNLPATGVVLQGPQCLVFILGGVQDSTNGNLSCFGFAKGSNPAPNPANVTGATQRYTSYNFLTTRLRQDKATNFFFYLDRWGMPYMLCGYDPGGTNYVPATGAYGNVAYTSCPTMPMHDTTGAQYPPAGVTAVTVAPFSSSSVGTAANQIVYLNPKWCQIISAGPDRQFGQGSPVNALGAIAGGSNAWNPLSGYGPGVAGSDDLSNFSGSPLAIAPN